VYHFIILKAIQREELKVKRSIKDAAKKGQVDVCKILAKEVVQSRKAVSKLYASKAQMNSVVMQMQNQLGEFNFDCRVNL
jgi:charged multivesicular body protein 3